jgi:hypothetical protein
VQRMEGACKQVMSSTHSEGKLGLMVRDERRNVASPSRVYCWNASTRDEPRQICQRRASRIMLNGVSVALRTCPSPPSRIIDDSFPKLACAPSAAPTG